MSEDVFTRLRAAKRLWALAAEHERVTRLTHEQAARELEEAKRVVERELDEVDRLAEREAGVRLSGDYDSEEMRVQEWIPVRR